MIKSVDRVLGLLFMSLSFFFPGFMKSVYLGGRGKRGGTMKVEKSAKITKQQKRENEMFDAHKLKIITSGIMFL